MEADRGADFDDVSIVSAVSLVGHIDPAVSAERDGSGRPVDRAEERGGLGVRLPHSTQWRPVTLFGSICVGRTGYPRTSLEYGRFKRPGEAQGPRPCTQADFGTRDYGANSSRDLRDAAFCARTFPVSPSVWCGGARR